MYKFWLTRPERKELDRLESVRKGRELLHYLVFRSPLHPLDKAKMKDMIEKRGIRDDEYECFWLRRPK